ncbi:MAG: LysM peptidoglycan-binding domain-containing protein [Lentisphaeria bacterium]|nr:LysM peptidoglycan-binding domain-containing protein [Lentisphaeria bacterium]
MKNMAKWTGAAAVLGGVLVLTGCQSSKVMDNRPYIPAASGDEIPAAMTQDPAPASEVKDLPVDPAPAAAPAVAPAEYPQFDSAAIEPVAPVKKNIAKGGIYVVQKGDTVSAIAYRHGVRTADVLAANDLDEKSARRLKVGQKLTIPKGGKAVPRKKSAKKAATVTAAAAVAADGTYTVRKGDNIPKIARKLGVKARDLMAANNLDDAATRRLQIGQKLVVPGKGATVAPAAEPAPAPANGPAVETAPAAVPAVTPAVETAPAEAAPAAAEAGTAAAPVEAAPATDKVEDTLIPATRMDQVTADISVRDYIKAKNLTFEEFKKLNKTVLPAFRPNGEDELDAIIPQGTAIFNPVEAPAEAPAAL